MVRPALHTPNSCVIEARCDIRLVATLARYFDLDLNTSPTKTPTFNKSALIRESLRLAAQTIPEEIEVVQTAEEAYQLLDELGYSLSTKGITNLRNQIVEETEREEHHDDSERNPDDESEEDRVDSTS